MLPVSHHHRYVSALALVLRALSRQQTASVDEMVGPYRKDIETVSAKRGSSQP